MNEAADGLDLLGAEAPETFSWSGAAVALASGAIGAVVWPAHRVLGFLGGAAVASNVHAVATKQRTPRQAAKRLGRHLAATAGALAMPSYPGVGYVAAAIAADLVISDDGDGIFDAWARHEGVAPEREVIDVTPVDNNKAMVKVP